MACAVIIKNAGTGTVRVPEVKGTYCFCGDTIILRDFMTFLKPLTYLKTQENV